MGDWHAASHMPRWSLRSADARFLQAQLAASQVFEGHCANDALPAGGLELFND